MKILKGIGLTFLLLWMLLYTLNIFDSVLYVNTQEGRKFILDAEEVLRAIDISDADYLQDRYWDDDIWEKVDGVKNVERLGCGSFASPYCGISEIEFEDFTWDMLETEQLTEKEREYINSKIKEYVDVRWNQEKSSVTTTVENWLYFMAFNMIMIPLVYYFRLPDTPILICRSSNGQFRIAFEELGACIFPLWERGVVKGKFTVMDSEHHKICREKFWVHNRGEHFKEGNCVVEWKEKAVDITIKHANREPDTYHVDLW